MARTQAISSQTAGSLSRAGQEPDRATVLRVPFTRDDLVLTRFGEAPAPLAEVFAGLVELRHHSAGPTANRWAAQARRSFPDSARPLLDLITVDPPWPSFLDPAVPHLDEGLEIVRSTPRSMLREEVLTCWAGPSRPPGWLRDLADGDPAAMAVVVYALREFFRVCIEPYWPSITATFRADVAERVPVLATGGLTGLFGSLHETLAWRDNGLERSGRAGTFPLRGRGLQILPSALWTGPPLFACQAMGLGGTALIYPARRPGPAYQPGQARDLPALIGHTRAAVLLALRTPRSTTELAGCVGVTAPTASEHASVLRAAGLVQTVRRGRGVSHSLTPLGRSLVSGNLNAH